MSKHENITPRSLLDLASNNLSHQTLQRKVGTHIPRSSVFYNVLQCECQLHLDFSVMDQLSGVFLFLDGLAQATGEDDAQ